MAAIGRGHWMSTNWDTFYLETQDLHWWQYGFLEMVGSNPDTASFFTDYGLRVLNISMATDNVGQMIQVFY